MSVSASIILKSTGKIAPGTDGYGESIVDGLEVLDRLAKKLKVTKFSSFLYDELEDDFYDIDHPRKPAKGPEWHDCADGVGAIEAVLNALKGKGSDKWVALLEDEGVDEDDVQSDLKMCLKALQKAAKKDDRFYMDIG
jgi:hypothetical protein